MVQGHNNNLTGISGDGDHQHHFVENLIIQGHNNKIENLHISGQLIVSGHNNSFVGLRLAGGFANGYF
jgi:hypothetical protein